jgi:hypothetical protein
MKYKYIGTETILVSSNKELMRVKQNDIVEFTQDDIKYQKLDKFIEIKEKNKKKEELKEED